MRRKIARVVSLSKKAGRFAKAKIQNRDFKNFYGGKSLGHLTLKTFQYLAKEGPLGFYRQAKRFLAYGGLNTDPTAAIKFPNGIKGYFDRKEIKAWFKEKGKRTLLIIPSYNDIPLITEAIASIRKFTPKGMYEIVVVDDYCQPENLPKLKALEAEDVTVFYRKKNGGFAHAVNEGLRIALERKLDAILINSDVVAKEGWYEALQFGAYNYHKDVGIVGPKLLYPDNRIQSAGSYRNTHAAEWFDHHYRFKPEDFGPANIPQYCMGVTGAVMYIKLDVLKKIGIFDQDYPMAFEEMDFTLRAWKAGYRVLYFPDSVLYHMESATRAKYKIFREPEKKSLIRFWKNWGDWLDNRNVKDKNGRIRVIYVLQTTGFSGGIKVVLEHVKRLHEMGGFAPEIWSLDEGPAWKVPVPHRSFTDYEKMTTALAQEEAIKVATWWETAQPVWLGSVCKGIPVYYIQEVETWFYPNDLMAQSAVLACYRHEFHNVTTSIYNEDELRSIQIPVEARVPVGVDTTIYFPDKKVKRETDVLFSMGREFFQKNFKFTLDAWKAMGEKRPRMWLYGRDKQYAKVDPKKITYYVSPTEEEVADMHRRSTFFVLTSYHEGFAMPPLEAMATGSPVIMTDCHGNRDYARDGENCLIVEQDNIPALKSAMQKILADPKLRERLGKNAIKMAKEFSWAKIEVRLANFYKEIAAQPKREYIKKAVKKYQ